MPSQKLRLSPEQQAAVDCSSPHLTLIASAGSGKTTVLVEKYLRAVIDENISPDQILAITFTKKAAAEMKTRIVRKLRDAGRDSDAQTAETGPIQTIHSFCDRLLRENALEAGLDPEFRLITEREFDDLFERLLTDSIAKFAEYDPDVQDLMMERIHEFDYQSPQAMHAKLFRDVRSVLENFRSAGWTPERMLEHYHSPGATLHTWFQSLLQEQPEEIQADFGNYGKADAVLRLEQKRIARSLPPAIMANRIWEESQETQNAQRTSALAKIVADVWQNLNSTFHENQWVDFNALESLAVHLLENNSRVKEKLSHQIQLLMVDESQDVNPVQYRLLDQLPVQRTLFIGDPQQSIYRFRHADRSLFAQRAADPERTRLPLSRNFRSEQPILHFIDEAFQQLWAGDYQPMAAPAGPMDFDAEPTAPTDFVEIWKLGPRGRLKPDQQVAAWVAELIQEGVGPHEIAVLANVHLRNQAVAGALQALNIKTRMIGATEKFYARMEIRDLANALLALTQPADNPAFLPFLLSPFVGLSLDAVVLLSQEEDPWAALSAFEPELPSDREALDSFFRWFPTLHAYADRIPAWELMGELFALTDYWAKALTYPHGPQAVANLRKLQLLAVEEPTMTSAEFADRLRRVRELRHRESEAPIIDESSPAVTLMTAHNSKGLEFPVVVVYLDERRATKARATADNELQLDAKRGLFVAPYRDVPCSYRTWLAKRNASEGVQEEQRLLYVALTRAQQRLCVIVPAQSSGALKTLEQTFGKGKVTEARVRVRMPS
ncbi:MAG TPA: UvrD-helicase domain-containing protein [Fimbriimonadaceae bacterium]|nr:UvrD-helicase domain-containing protein [Fimbriimonadaceae bacterium]HRJ32422.1 UvrD-helicase domain-containing protein [Fimbriimonadaceae bacterium]